jgi:hypothetical protein
MSVTPTCMVKRLSLCACAQLRVMAHDATLCVPPFAEYGGPAYVTSHARISHVHVIQIAGGCSVVRHRTSCRALVGRRDRALAREQRRTARAAARPVRDAAGRRRRVPASAWRLCERASVLAIVRRR